MIYRNRTFRRRFAPVLRAVLSILSDIQDLSNRTFSPRRFGVKVLFVHRGKLLIVRHTYGTRRWTLPGGGVKRGEMPVDAAKREMHEELYLKIEPEWIGEYFTMRHGAKDTVQCFRVKLDAMPENHDPVEIDTVMWISPQELPEPISPTVSLVWEMHTKKVNDAII